MPNLITVNYNIKSSSTLESTRARSYYLLLLIVILISIIKYSLLVLIIVISPSTIAIFIVLGSSFLTISFTSNSRTPYSSINRKYNILIALNILL